MNNCDNFSDENVRNFFNIGDFDCNGKPLLAKDARTLKKLFDAKKVKTAFVRGYIDIFKQNFDYDNQGLDVQKELDGLKQDALNLYNGNFGSANCTLDGGCVELSNDIIIFNKLLELSSKSQSDINIINHKISDNQYDIYILGDEILELLLSFEVPLEENDIKVTESYKSLFNNLFNNDDYKTNGLDAFKIYDKKLYVARLSNSEKIATNSDNWNLKQFNDSNDNNNYKMFESKYPIKNVEKIIYGNQITDTNNVNIINV
jgi:hypothetical protein